MRHQVRQRKLNRTASHRKAMLSNMAVSILDKERIETTVEKAKEVRRVVERLITFAKKGDLHSRRIAAKRVNDETVLKKLFDVIGPSFKTGDNKREGGYTRVIKTRNRKGDNAVMAIVELVGIGGAETVRKRRKKKAAETAPGAAKTAPAAEAKA